MGADVRQEDFDAEYAPARARSRLRSADRSPPVPGTRPRLDAFQARPRSTGRIRRRRSTTSVRASTHWRAGTAWGSWRTSRARPGRDGARRADASSSSGGCRTISGWRSPTRVFFARPARAGVAPTGARWSAIGSTTTCVPRWRRGCTRYGCCAGGAGRSDAGAAGGGRGGDPRSHGAPGGVGGDGGGAVTSTRILIVGGGSAGHVRGDGAAAPRGRRSRYASRPRTSCSTSRCCRRPRPATSNRDTSWCRCGRC